MNPITALTRLLFPHRPTPAPPPRPPAPPAPRPVSPDTVHLSGAAQDDDLGQILRHVAAAAQAAKSRPPAAHESAEAEIGSLLAGIDGVEGPEGAGNRHQPRYKITDIHDAVARHSVHGVRLPPGGSVDVNIEVLASAQPAALFLSFGGGGLDLATADSRFTISIGGRGNATELTFASGTSVGAMAAAINTFAGEHGLQADVSGSGLSLRSTALGADEFVSVSVVDDGGLDSAGAGVYRMRGDDAREPDPGARTGFSAAENIRDAGQDIRALVNGVEARADGATLRVRTDQFRAAFTLHDFAALRTGVFTAFRITRGR